MKPNITEKELDLLDAHLYAAEQILAELKKKSVAIRESLSLTGDKPPSKYMLRKAQGVAEALAYLERLRQNRMIREQKKNSKA